MKISNMTKITKLADVSMISVTPVTLGVFFGIGYQLAEQLGSFARNDRFGSSLCENVDRAMILPCFGGRVR